MGGGAADSELEAWLSEKEDAMVEDITSLVKIPSVSGEQEGSAPYGKTCRAVLHRMLEIAGGYGFSCHSFRDKCAVIRYGDGTKKIGIWGHLDVVPEGTGYGGCCFIFKGKPGSGSLFCDGLRISGVLWGKRNLQGGNRIGET